MSQDWKKRFSVLIGELTSKSDLASFRTEYREIIDAVYRKPSHPPEPPPPVYVFLIEARDLLEQWVATSVVSDPQMVFGQWLDFYAKARPLVPEGIVPAFLRKLPQLSAAIVDWREFVLQCTSPEIIETLIKRRMLTKKLLSDWILKSTDEFYGSAAIDVAVEQSLIEDYGKFWNACRRLGKRRTTLKSQAQLLLWCYSQWDSADADVKLLEFLSDDANERQAVLTAILDDTPLALRFANAFAKRLLWHQTPDARTVQVFQQFIGLCVGRIENGGDAATAIRVTNVVSCFRLSYEIGKLATSNHVKPDPKIDTLLHNISQKCAESVLSQLEESPARPHALSLLLLSGSELYRVLQSHLHSLTKATGAESQPVDRGAQYQRNLAKKELLQSLLDIANESDGDFVAKEELEVLLFNSGVLPIIEVGEKTTFDPRLHDLETPGVAPGEGVEVIASGAKLGDPPNELVLKRAVVRALDC